MRLQDMPESKAELPRAFEPAEVAPETPLCRNDPGSLARLLEPAIVPAVCNCQHQALHKTATRKQQMHPQRESRDHHRPWCRHTLGPAACPQGLCHIFHIFGNLMTAYTSTCAKFGTVSLKHTAPAKILENVACVCGSCSRIAGAA